MARIEPNTFTDYNDGATLHGDEFDQILEIIRTGVNANYDDIVILKNGTLGTITGVRAGVAFPTTPVPQAGHMFYRSDEDKMYYYNGTVWSTKKKQEPLISLVLQSGWINYQAGQEGVYYKDDLGRAYVSGRFKNGASADGTLLATLPTGYKPVKDYFIRSRNCDVLIAADGTIKLYSVTLVGDIGIDGISFRVE